MPAAGRVVEVDLDRLPGWVERFAARHGALTVAVVGSAEETEVVGIAAADGARADLTVPFGPLSASTGSPIERLIDQVAGSRTVGVLLVRRGGWAAAVVTNGGLVAADTGGGYVQGTTKAGGWSQQRYARRRGNQTQQVWDRAVVGAVQVFAPHRPTIGALLTGGDRAGVSAVLGRRAAGRARATGRAALLRDRRSDPNGAGRCRTPVAVRGDHAQRTRVRRPRPTARGA